jgi:hypothetical protein
MREPTGRSITDQCSTISDGCLRLEIEIRHELLTGKLRRKTQRMASLFEAELLQLLVEQLAMDSETSGSFGAVSCTGVKRSPDHRSLQRFDRSIHIPFEKSHVEIRHSDS